MRQETREALIRVLDLCREGLLLCDCTPDNRTRYLNPGLQRLLAEDSQRERIQCEIDRIVDEVCARAEEVSRPGEPAGEVLTTREVSTDRCRYHLRAGCLGIEDPERESTLAVIAVDAVPIEPLSDRVLRGRYKLSKREAEIARLLVQGRSNTEIAEALGVSPNTTHQYTDRVFLKLGVRNRTEVGAKLLLD